MKRPVIFDYEALNLFIRDMIAFRKETEDGYSVAKACQSLERCSPGLVSSLAQGRRRVTADRVSDLAVVLGLSAREKLHLRDRVSRPKKDAPEPPQPPLGKRRQSSAFLLKSWLNPYVKDAVRLESVRKSQAAIFKVLGGIASKKAIEQSLKFLLAQGYLRLTQDGRWVENEVLNVLGDRHANQKIRQFHKKALDIAREGLDLYPVEERLAQALILPLDDASYAELVDLLKEFSEKLRLFSEKHATSNQRLYQIIIHLTPTGGQRD